jgi:hypothetical protein
MLGEEQLHGPYERHGVTAVLASAEADENYALAISSALGEDIVQPVAGPPGCFAVHRRHQLQQLLERGCTSAREFLWWR